MRDGYREGEGEGERKREGKIHEVSERRCVAVKQGNRRPGGLLISTGEYHKISYSICSIHLFGHLPRLIWMLTKFSRYSLEAERNPGQ